ncbi:MAG: hypothetical protein R6U93_04780 [Dehalococcoidia bacterium]
MGAFTDAQCFKCGKDIKDSDRVVVVTVTRGRFNSTEDTVAFDPYDDANSIFHEECYLKK